MLEKRGPEISKEPKFHVGELVYLKVTRQLGVVEKIANMPGHYRIGSIGVVPEDELETATSEQHADFENGIRYYRKQKD